MWRRIITNSDLTLCVFVMVIGLWLVKGLHKESSDEAVVMATLAGALFGGAAVLLGNWINRLNDRQRAEQEEDRAAVDLERRRIRLTRLIVAEMVNVAAGFIDAHRIVRAALTQVESTGAPVPLDMRAYLPREMPFTDGLREDLWLLEPPAIDALVTLRSNLAVTRMQMEEVTALEGGAWRLNIASLMNGLRHTTDVLAQCFDHIAPTRQLELPDRPPELAATILRRLARGERN